MMAISLVFDVGRITSIVFLRNALKVDFDLWLCATFSKSLLMNYAAVDIFCKLVNNAKIPTGALLPMALSLAITSFVRLDMPIPVLMDMFMLSLIPPFIMLMVGFLIRVWARYDALGAALSVSLAVLTMLAALMIRFGVRPVLSRAWMAFWLMAMYFFWSAQRSMTRTNRRFTAGC